MTYRAICFASAAAAFCAMPALAHHSFAMFDQSKTVELHGTVKELLWTNPHSWLQIMAPDENGEMVEWSIEMSAPGALMRDGWTRESVAPGDDVTVMAHPIRSGSTGGQFVSIVLANGQELSHIYRDP